MKKIGIIIAALFISSSIFAANVLTPASSVVIPQRSENPPESPHFEKCLKWKRVCHQKTYCTQREHMRNGCYRCVKPQHTGFHIYPRQMERQTCNLKTVDYLRNMGYNCYQNYESSPCVASTQREYCDWACTQYAKE